MTITAPQQTPRPARLAHLARLLATVALAYTAAIIAGIFAAVAHSAISDALLHRQAPGEWRLDQGALYLFITLAIIGWLVLWPALIGFFVLVAIFENSIRRRYWTWSVVAIASATAAVAVYCAVVNKGSSGGMELAVSTFFGATTFAVVGRLLLGRGRGAAGNH